MNAPAPAARILRGYGPLLAFAVLFCLMAAFVPTVGDEVRTVPAEAVPAGEGSPADYPAGGTEDAGPGASLSAGGSPAGGASGASTPGSPARGTGGGSGTAAGPQSPTGGQPATGGGPAASVRPCPNRPGQVQGDPYSPPCLIFSGDNGGAGGRGVTGDKVVISVRLFEFPEMSIGPEDGPQTTFAIDKEELKATVAALAEYFNTRFQLYGRKLEPVFFDGTGDILAEFQGAGQEEAEADAVKAAEEIKPFAELFAITTPYADALSRRQVVNIGAPVMSRQWHAARWRYRPGAWPASDPAVFRGSGG